MLNESCRKSKNNPALEYQKCQKNHFKGHYGSKTADFRRFQLKLLVLKQILKNQKVLTSPYKKVFLIKVVGNQKIIQR